MPLSNEQQKLVEENMGLVGKVITDRVRGINAIGIFTYDDIYQIGCLGLINASLRYAPGKAKFSTYAYMCIRNEIYSALDYATVRKNMEPVISSAFNLSLVHDDISDSVSDLQEIIGKSKDKACNMISNGIDAILLKTDGYSFREIGEMLGGVPANNVTAWVSNARVYLKKNPAIQAMR